MHGLPADLDLSFLVGPTLLQVCIGENEVILRFDGDVSITIESTFVVRDEGGCETAFECARAAASALVEFLADSITEVLGQRSGTLRLTFSRGGVVEIYDSFEDFESYQIQHGKDLHVV
jgi:hypothetical protein